MCISRRHFGSHGHFLRWVLNKWDLIGRGKKTNKTKQRNQRQEIRNNKQKSQMAHSPYVHTCTILNSWFSAEEPISDKSSGRHSHSWGRAWLCNSAGCLSHAVTASVENYICAPITAVRTHRYPNHTWAGPPTLATCHAHHSHPSLPYAALAQRPSHRATLGWAVRLGHLAAGPAPKAALCWVMRSDRALQAPWVPQLCPFNWMWHQQGTCTCHTVLGLSETAILK